MASSPVSGGLVPVHIGHAAAEVRTEPEPEASGWPGRWHQIRLSSLDRVEVNWSARGVEPRWLGMETADCAVALEPSIFASSGADELKRFLAGAADRGEVAVVVALIGHAEDDSPRSVLHPADASVSLPGGKTGINGRRLPASSRVRVAGDVDGADRDLGLRLINRPADTPWWSLSLTGRTWHPGSGGPPITHKPEGELRPILVDALGEPVVAVWISSDAQQRWYVIPDVIDWNAVLDWLVHHALPEYVPEALRRVRASSFVDLDLQTQAEVEARQALADMEVRYAKEKAQLEADLARAHTDAETIRYGLLYCTGSELVEAVKTVLEAAGFTTVDLDEDLGATRSADLVATLDQHRRLVEIKAAGGNAGEALVGDLLRHLRTWPELRPNHPVQGGVLVVNHQHKLHPNQRTAQVYNRREFVNTLTVPVVSTLDLFNWWRNSDWAAIQHAIVGTAPSVTNNTAPNVTTDQPGPLETSLRKTQPWWRRRKRTSKPS